MRTRVLIVDHAIARQGLRSFLEPDPEIEVVGEAGYGREAVRLLHRLRPAVVLIDLALPEMDGIATTQTIRQQLPEIQVVALTSVLERDSVGAAVRAGAIGYLLKDIGATDLRQAIKAAAVGEVSLSPAAAPTAGVAQQR